ncbi:uncharacterized protein rab44 isoform X2 [Vanacampus margaritifer]
MPGPSGKRRLGSRRRGPTHVEVPEDLSVADQTSEAQPNESGESLTPLSNEGHSSLETDGMLSSEQRSSRRKLGSKRQSKVHNSEQSAIESYHKPTEEVEQDVHTEEVQAQMIPAGQAVRHQEFSEMDFDSLYGTHLYSAYTPGHALEAFNPAYPDSDLERHQPISENMHVDQDAGESDREQVEKTDKHWSVKQQLHDQSEFTAMSVQHTFIDAGKKYMDEDPPQPGEALQFDHLNVKSEEIDFPCNPERPPEKNSHCENVEIKNSVEQVDYSPAAAEVPSNEEHEPFNFLQVQNAHIPDQNEIEEIKSDQIDYHEIVTHDEKEPIDKYLENLTAEIVELYQVEQKVKSSTDSWLNPQDKQEEQLLKDIQAPDTNEARIIVEQMETTPCQEKVVNEQAKVKVEQTQQSNSREMVFTAETYGDSKDAAAAGKPSNDDASKMKELTFIREAAVMTKMQMGDIVNLDTFPGEDMHDLVRGNARSNSTIPQLLTRLSNYDEMPEEVDEAKTNAGEENETFTQSESLGDALEISTPKSSLNEDTEIEHSVVIAAISSSKAETSTDEHEHFDFSQIQEAALPDKNLVEETKSLETHQTKDSEILTDVPTSDVDKDIENLVSDISETRMSDLSMKSTFDSGLNPQDNTEKYHMQEDNREVLEQRDENNHASDTQETLINTEKTERTQSQEHDKEAQGTSDVEPWNTNVHADTSWSQPLVDAQVSTPTPETSTSESCFHKDAELEYSVAIATMSSPKAEASADEQQEHFSFSQVRAAQDPDKDFINEANSLESDQIKESVILVDGPTGDVDENIENLDILETRRSDLSVKSLNPQDHIEKDDMEDLEQREKNDCAVDTMVTWINAEKTDPTQIQQHDEAQGMSDVDQSELSSQSVHPVESFVFDSQSEDNAPSTDEQRDSFSHATNRRKLGSSRRNKRSQVNVFAADIHRDFEDDTVAKTRDYDGHPGDKKQVTFQIEPAEMEKSRFKETDHLDTLQDENLVGGNARVRLSEVITPNTRANMTEPQLLTEQSSSKEMPKEEELLVVSETKAGDENETSAQNENVHADYLVSRPLVDAEVSNAPLELSTSKSSNNEGAEIECNVAKAAETSTDEQQHQQSNFSQVREVPSSDFVSIKDLKSSELDPNEDSEIASPRRNRRKLGSSRRHKGSLVKDVASETCNESTDDAARNRSGKEALPEETTEIKNALKNTLNDDVNIQRGPTNAVVSLPKEEMEEQCSEGDSTQHLENNINKMLKQEVNPVEANELNDIDDSIVKKICSTAGITQLDASVDSESYEKATQRAWDQTLPVAAETRQQASQELMKAIFKTTEKIQVEKSQDIQEEDSISPNTDKDDVANVQMEDTDGLRVSQPLINVYSASNLDVQESEKNTEAASLKGEALENSETEKAVEEITDRSELSNASLTPTKKRRMGSTRRSRINGKQEAETDGEPDTKALGNEASTKSSCEEEQKFNQVEANPMLHNSTGERNMIAATDDVTTVFSEQVASHDAKDANPLTSQVADVRESGRETFEPVPESKLQLLSNTSGVDRDQDASGLPKNDHMDQQANIQAMEGDRSPDNDLKSPVLNLTTKKRKMGSTRRNLGTKSKGDLELKLDSSSEEAVTTFAQDVATQPAGQMMIRDEPESSGAGSTNQENIGGDAPRKTGRESLTSEHRPEKISEELEVGGRKRKLGSHRKSRAQQTHVTQSEEDITMQKPPERNLEKTTHTQAEDTIQGPEESQSNIGDTKPSSDISNPVINETSVEAIPSRAQQDTWKVSFGKSSDVKAKPYNVVMIGDSYVGKTSFMKRAQNGKFFRDLPASAGLDTCLWTVVVDGKSVALQLWDTAGQERFRSITTQVFHRAHAFLLMYDITSSQSFAAVDYWAKCIQEGAMENVPILLLGNKSDHAERHVTTEEGQDVAKVCIGGDRCLQERKHISPMFSFSRSSTLTSWSAAPCPVTT